MTERPDPAAPHAPAPDASRLGALASYGILDAPPEQGFDDVVRLARTLCAAPMARVGLVTDERRRSETDPHRSVRELVLSEPDLLVIPDLAADPLTVADPLVKGEPSVRFYAGAPLRTDDGLVLGSLCVLDHEPRPEGLGEAQAEGLRLLARQAVRELEARRRMAERDAVLALQDAALRKERRLEALAEASAALSASDDPAATIMPILGAEAAALGFDQAYAYTVDARGRRLALAHAVGVDVAARAFLSDVPYDVPLCGIVADTGDPLILDNVQAGAEPRHRVARDAGIDAFAGYPVKVHGEIRLVISFGSTRKAAFDAETLAFLATVARFLTLAEERLDGLARLRDRERELTLERGLLRAVLDQAPVGMSIAYADGTATFSARAEAMLGHGPRFVGDDRYAGYHAEHPDGRPYRPGEYPTVRALRGGETVRAEPMRYRPGGGAEVRRWSVSGTPVRAPDGAILAAVTVFTDLEDQLRANDALARSLDDLSRAQEAGGVGLFTMLVDDDVLYPTPEFCRLYGLPVRDSYPATVIEAQVLPEDRAVMSTAATRRRGEAIPEVEYRVRHPGTGAVRWLARSGRIETDAAGRPHRFTGAARDVTEQRATRQALAESRERLDLAFEAAGTVGWNDWDIQADVLRGGGSFARMFGVPAEVATGGAPIARFMAAIHPDDRERVGAQVEAATAGAQGFDGEYRLLAADGAVTWVHSLGRIRYDGDGRPVRFTGILADVTAARRAGRRQAALLALGDRMRDLPTEAEVALAACAALGETLDAMLVGYGTVDAAAETITVERDWTAGGAGTLAGTLRFRDFGTYIDDLKRGETVVVDDARTDPRTRAYAEALEAKSARAFVNVPVVERGAFVALLYVSTATARVWDEGELAFVREVAERVRLATARLRAEERQGLLNNELSHRLKNILAMVQAIATQTLRNAPDPAAARDALADRLIALGKAHDVLMTGTGESADLATVVREALTVHGAGDARVDVAGPPVACAAQPALSVALMMHELATNAAKYGALSVPEGRVAVEWALYGPAERQEISLAWRERGGPPVTPPARQGFGSKLILRGLAGAVGGVAKLDYLPAGVTCTLAAPLAGFRGEA